MRSYPFSSVLTTGVLLNDAVTVRWTFGESPYEPTLTPYRGESKSFSHKKIGHLVGRSDPLWNYRGAPMWPVVCQDLITSTAVFPTGPLTLKSSWPSSPFSRSGSRSRPSFLLGGLIRPVTRFTRTSILFMWVLRPCRYPVVTTVLYPLYPCPVPTTELSLILNPGTPDFFHPKLVVNNCFL